MNWRKKQWVSFSVTNVIDYHEYVACLRLDETVFSVYYFAHKVRQALAGGLGGFAIGAIGCNAADKIQSEAVVQGTYCCNISTSFIFFVICLILIFFYFFTKKRTNLLAFDLAKQRKVTN